MKKRNFYTIDLPPSLLSVFDLGGFIYFGEDKPISRGWEHDWEQLSCDHSFLIEDYKKACEWIKSEMEQLHEDTYQRH